MEDQVFSVQDLQHQPGLITATLRINVQSSILKGHFPGEPVVPGACLMQMVKDVLEQVLSESIMLMSAPNVKFINMLTPQNSPISYLKIQYKITEEGMFAVTAQVAANDAAYFKLQATYSKI